MTTTLMDGTATGVEVYVGQSLVVVGAVVLGAGLVGLLLSLGLVAARTLVSTASPVAPTALTLEDETPETSESELPASAIPAPVETAHVASSDDASDPDGLSSDEDQKGSSGSIATATNSSVR